MAKREFTVTGMTCTCCESSVRKGVEAIAGVNRIELSHEDGRLVVTTSDAVADEAIIAVVADAGFAAERA